jgi:hypothetical protein
MVTEGFMHIDITEELKNLISPKRPNNQQSTTASDSNTVDLNSNNDVQQPTEEITPSIENPKVHQKPVPIEIPMSTPCNTTNPQASASSETPSKIPARKIRLELELFDNDEHNISHISISAVRKKSQDEV